MTTLHGLFFFLQVQMWFCKKIQGGQRPPGRLHNDLPLGQKLGSEPQVAGGLRLGGMPQTSTSSSLNKPSGHRLGFPTNSFWRPGEVCLQEGIPVRRGSSTGGAGVHLSRRNCSRHRARIFQRSSRRGGVAKMCQG